MISRPTRKHAQRQHGRDVRRADGKWYQDPFDPERLRWFDGHGWTQQTVPAGSAPSGDALAPLHSANQGRARVADLLGDMHRPAH